MDLSASTILHPGWKIRSIDDACQRVTSGGTPSRRAPEFYSNGIWPWVKTQELRDGWLRDTEEYITEEAVQRSSAKVLPKNTVLLAMYGATVGKLALLARDMTCNQACCALVVDDAVADYRFVYYALLNARPKLVNLAVGAAQQNLSGTTIKSLRFVFPPLSEQRAIASILAALDEKIELNRKMSATLEAMARALFKSWFVDFDPVRAKAEGRDPGLPPEIAALFPDSFEESELGEIPKDWRVGSLGAVAVNARRGISHNDIPEGTPYIGLEHMPRRSIALERWEHAAQLESNKSQFRQGDFLFGKLRPYFHKVGVAPVAGVCSTDILVVSPASADWAAFVLMHLSSDELVAHTDRCSTGTKMPRASWEHISRYEVANPPVTVARSFAMTIAPMVQRIVAAIHESRTLAALRDALLPKLISGEIRVTEAERIVEKSA